MKKIWTQPLSRQIGIAALAALAMHGVIVLIQWYAVSPIGFGGMLLLQFVILPFLPLLIVLLVLPISLFLLLFRKVRRHAVTILICGLIYVLIGLAIIRVSYQVRMHGFRRLALRSQPLVEAIHKFVDDEGRPPTDLQELVPNYLPKVPRTGMPAYPEYQYSTDVNGWDENPWVVYIDCTSGGINFDMFMYFPKQNYPKTGYGGSLERIGEWAYVHE